MKKIQTTLLAITTLFLFSGCALADEKIKEQSKTNETKQYPYFLKIQTNECRDVRIDKESTQVAYFLSKQENVKEKEINNTLIATLEKEGKPFNFYFFTDKESCEEAIKIRTSQLAK